jgi:hypothetical protein
LCDEYTASTVRSEPCHIETDAYCA